MKQRHELRIVGITYNQIESGVYAVILQEADGIRRIPIIIGYPEAQAIECKLQEVMTPRPLTHDLICRILDSFGLVLSCVEIHKLPNGVFAADLIMEGSDGTLHRIDSRSSDAIAIAIRTGSPIYTSEEVLEESGFTPRGEDEGERPSIPEEEEAKPEPEDDGMRHYSDLEIEEMIVRLAGEERYEEAARLKQLLQRRQNKKDNNQADV